MGFLPFFLAFDHTKDFSTYPRKKNATHDAHHRKKIYKRRISKGGVNEKLSSSHGAVFPFCLLFGFLRFTQSSCSHSPFDSSSSAKTNIMFHHLKVAT